MVDPVTDALIPEGEAPDTAQSDMLASTFEEMSPQEQRTFVATSDEALFQALGQKTIQALRDAFGGADTSHDWSQVAEGPQLVRTQDMARELFDFDDTVHGTDRGVAAPVGQFYLAEPYAPAAQAAAPAATQTTLLSDMQLSDINIGPSAHMSLPTDTLFSQQWHLNQTVGGLLDLGDLSTIWDEYTGAGVEVVIVDDAIQRTHQDLDANYSSTKDWDFDNNDTDPSGVDGQNHGTAVAGIIGANRDGVGTVGVAYDSTIFGFQVNGFISDTFMEQIELSIDNASGVTETVGVDRTADIVNMSLGTMFASNYFDTFLTQSVMAAANQAIDEAAVVGRDGLGTIMVKSAGNSRLTNPSEGSGNQGHDANASSWNANIHTISVAAVDQDGDVSIYSSHGANILISGFGTPFAGEVVTTDRMGNEGYNPGGGNQPADVNYTGSFNGTSAAAPMVSGVIALMLEANSELGWRDVQEILAYSARHVGTAIGSGTSGSEEYAWAFNGASTWNGGGLHFSNDYGFGLVDAFAAVRMAEMWTTANGANKTSANDTITFNDVLNASQTLTGSNIADSFTFTPSSNVEIEHVTVDINFLQWDDLGDLDIVLIAPDGTRIHLIDNVGENSGNATGGFGSGRWEFTSPGLMGMNSTGTWTLELRDQDSSVASPIVINDIDIRFHGKGDTTNDHFVFTNEFSDYAGSSTHGTNFNGGTGTDTINTVAVTSDVVIDLLTNSGTIDGVAITNANIEQVFTGDGNDEIIGDSFSVLLDGGRGNDTITGGIASEEIIGGAGNDVLSGGGGDDTVRGGDGNDTLIGGGTGTDLLQGEDGNDTFEFTAGDHRDANIDGGDGNDRILLSGLGTFNFDGAGLALTSIEEIEFNADVNGTKIANFTIKEFDNIIEVPTNLRIDSSGGNVDILNFSVVGAVFATIDWSGWIFQNWDDTLDELNITLGGAVTNFTGTSERDNIEGGSNAETINGDDDNDYIDGNAGDDTIFGGEGNDTLEGGSGVDSLNGGNGDDVFVQFNGWSGGDTYNGGAGTDTFDTSGNTAFNVVANLGAGTWSGGGGPVTLISVENLIDTDGDGDLTGSSVANLIDGAGGDDTIDGGGGNDTLFGREGDDMLEGGSGNDTMRGGVGNDTLDGGFGTDDNFGGSGDDLMFMRSGDGVDNYDGGSGTDTVDFTDTNIATLVDLMAGGWRFGAGALTNDMVNVENLNMSGGDDTVTGSNAANEIYGRGGNDSLNGMGGADYLNGENGDDTVNGGDGDDELRGGAGVDLLIGGAGNDNIRGGNDDDTLRGQAGQDTLTGGNGVDFLRGGADADTLDGGADTDTAQYTTDTADLTINLGAGTGQGGDAQGDVLISIENIISGSGNDDLIGSSADNMLEGMDGNDTLRGGSGEDTLIGGNGDDVLAGGGGDDSVRGGNGRDQISGRDGADTLNGGNDVDTLQYQSDTVGVNIHLGNNTASGGEAAGDVISNFENVTGGSGNDILTGSDVRNVLVGGLGDDQLRGGNGNDVLVGEKGDDFLAGGNGNDTLKGSNGDDTLKGGAGNDVLRGSNGEDVFIFGAGSDDDRLVKFETGIDTVRIEGLTQADVSFSNAGGGNTLMTLSTGDTVLFTDISVGDLNTFDDFVFV
ncbi:S8 family serine peptidase [Tateyamaria omphalii]|uniref:S8 family serine peptidase n=1 Tax=Tateyamaria omphalii TaxID=299262 RepID=UPI0015600A1C|nr:S8 family serine peptidase [Tateyamaria omphalii]